jgi:SAM-dependent methyltransferase
LEAQPDPVFDEAAYLSRYDDVRAAVRNGLLSSGWEHFQRFGQFEGRMACRIDESEPSEEDDFDEGTYLWLHPDVLRGVEAKLWASGYEHFQTVGKAEGRRMATQTRETSHALRDYTKLVRELIAQHPDDLPLAMAKAIGSTTLAGYARGGDQQYAILKRAGLTNDQAVYDLACGSGRTAAALARNGWQGRYRGADLIRPLVEFAAATKLGYEFFVHRDYSIRAADASLDMVYAFSLFTHLQLEEILLYSADIRRALKPGGTLVFTLLTLDCPAHRELLQNRATMIKKGPRPPHLDTFLSRSTVASIFENMLGFELVEWVAADDATATPTGALGQAVAIYRNAKA